MKIYTGNTVCASRQPRYPNEADRSYFEQKLLDAVTSVITGMGVVTILCWLLLL